MIPRRGQAMFTSWFCRRFTTASVTLDRRRHVLGIESSCDDTGAAVVDDHGNVLGEALFSQKEIHLEYGGIIPPIARDLHAKHIDRIVNEAMQRSGILFQDLEAVATTVKPGLPLSLLIGMNYGKMLCRKFKKPFIPIHHMEAHALTIRMTESVPFPFLVLLISGGHSLLCVARDVDDFLLLGYSVDDAPGEAFDKTARRLKLTNLPECAQMSGGEAIEHLAKSGNPLAFNLTVPMNRRRDCNFSFSGVKFTVLKCLTKEEIKYGIEADGVLPNVSDICASFQLTVSRHLMKRVQRAVTFCELKGLLPKERRSLVIAGGVARNDFIRSTMQKMCDLLSVKVICPSPKLCSDNGIMIAWNGMERLMSGVGVLEDFDLVDIDAKCTMGNNISAEVFAANIKLPRLKINFGGS